MKLKYEAKKNSRIKYRFMGFTSEDHYWIYNTTKGKWVQEIGDDRSSYYSSHAPCNSVKAFRRMLKNAPAGVKFTLVSRWVGMDVFGTGSLKEVTH